MSDNAIIEGSLVRRRSNPADVGKVLSLDWDDQDEAWWARVQFPNRVSGQPLDELELWDTARGDMWESLQQGNLSTAVRFERLMTWERLRRPATPIVAAFGTARAKLFPYQFKPLLKFLDHPDHRLLIADDVGLGKTIEAGYILRECRARTGIDRALIMVPARLRTKWKSELEKRFGEKFDVVMSRDVVAHFRQVERGRELEPFLWIVSYESMRTPEVVSLLEALRPPMDLVILDEAHRVRNTATAQYRCARALSTCADGLLFLTATPVQTGIENLHTLLNLLEPQRYGQVGTFQQQIDANRPIIRAVQCVSAGQYAEAADHLAEMVNNAVSASLAQEPAFLAVIERLQATQDDDRAERVALQRDIDEFSLTGHVVSRTRKVDVVRDKPVRDAQSPKIVLTEDEKAIYDSVRAITRVLYPATAGWGQSMAALMAFRYTASCIPAGVEYMKARLAADGILWDADVAAQELDGDFSDEAAGGVSASDDEILKQIRSVLARCPAPGCDSKFVELRRVIREVWTNDAAANRPRRKIIVFSYFRRTLRYLDEQLRRAGMATRLIHGDVSIEDRETRVEEFLSEPEVNVLLSSEVGGEGLDLQRASVIVNYDLPWNPMVVEQRIGRIDRIGQTEKRLIIVNLISDDTIEERILLRLYNRIGVFQGSIGEIEEILGPAEVTQLMIAALRGELSEAELEQQVEQTAHQVERQKLHAQKLASNVDGLLAADQAFLDEIKALQQRRRVPTSGDLYNLLIGFLRERYAGIEVEGNPRTGHAQLQVGHQARQDLRNWAAARPGSEALRVATRTERGPLAMTMDAEVAMDRPRCEFIQHQHPLIQFAVDSMRAGFEPHTRAFAIQLESTAVPAGDWVVGVWRVDTVGDRSDSRVEAVAYRLDDETILTGESAEDLLIEAVTKGREFDPRPDLPVDALKLASGRLRSRFRRVFREHRERERERLARRMARVRATWETTLRVRLQRAESRLETLQRKAASASVIRATQGQVRKRQSELDAKLDEFEKAPEPSFGEEELAVAIVRVEVGG